MQFFNLHLGNPLAGLQSHLYLRVAALALTASIVIALDRFYQPVEQLRWLVLTLLATALWTLGRLLHQTDTRQPRWQFTFELALDYLWVFAVVALVGRSTNPFIYYYLVLSAVAAAALPLLFAWAFCALGILIYSFMMYLDLNAHYEHMPRDYQVHLLGMWVNYVGSSLVICVFVGYLRRWGQAQQEKLTQLRENQLKNEQLIGIGTVAATTIHSLATPLATLHLLAEEMSLQPCSDEQTAQDLHTMKTQITRCRNTIAGLSELARQHDEIKALTVAQIVTALADHYTLQQPDLLLDIQYATPCEDVMVLADPLLIHALINLVNNALESDQRNSRITFWADQNNLHVTIRNHSAQAMEDILQRWGRPGASSKETGLGIGSMLANSTIERLQGAVTLERDKHQQVSIRIQLRRYHNPRLKPDAP